MAMYPRILEPQVKRTTNHKMSEKHMHISIVVVCSLIREVKL